MISIYASSSLSLIRDLTVLYETVIPLFSKRLQIKLRDHQGLPVIRSAIVTLLALWLDQELLLPLAELLGREKKDIVAIQAKSKAVETVRGLFLLIVDC